MAEDLSTNQQLELLNEQLTGLRKELAADYVPRAEQRRSRRQAVVVLVLAVLLTLVVENGAINRCFFNPAGGLERRVCSVMFPGYGPAMAQGQTRQTQMVRLLEGIPANAEQIRELQDRVDRLERQQR